jgi:predicted permease
MIVVGLSLLKSKVKEMFKKKIYLLTFVRLLLLPFITIFITRLIPFVNNSMIPGLLILMSVLPAVSTVSIIMEQYHRDTEAQAIFMTTLFRLITIPLVMYFV